MSENDNKELFQAINELEASIGLKQGFFSLLLKEDDWSFVIKIHALYEAAVSSLLLNSIGHKKLENFISRLELGDKSRGKLRLIKELGILNDRERKFIHSLSRIRNSFVHDVKNTQTSIEDYLNSLDKKERKDYIDTFSFTYSDYVEIAEFKVEEKVFTAENLKIAIWHQSIYILFAIATISATEKSKQESKEAIMKIHELQKAVRDLENR